MEKKTDDSQGASNPILRQANSIQIAVQANVEALGTLLYDETQKTFALQARVRELEAMNGLPASDPVTKHFGVHEDRFAREPLEALIGVLWNGKQEDGQLLSGILSKGHKPWYVNQRDATVAASVVQWLVSEGGLSFLRSVNEITEGRLLKEISDHE